MIEAIIGRTVCWSNADQSMAQRHGKTFCTRSSAMGTASMMALPLIQAPNPPRPLERTALWNSLRSMRPMRTRACTSSFIPMPRAAAHVPPQNPASEKTVVVTCSA